MNRTTGNVGLTLSALLVSVVISKESLAVTFQSEVEMAPGFTVNHIQDESTVTAGLEFMGDYILPQFDANRFEIQSINIGFRAAVSHGNWIRTDFPSAVLQAFRDYEFNVDTSLPGHTPVNVQHSWDFIIGDNPTGLNFCTSDWCSSSSGFEFNNRGLVALDGAVSDDLAAIDCFYLGSSCSGAAGDPLVFSGIFDASSRSTGVGGDFGAMVSSDIPILQLQIELLDKGLPGAELPGANFYTAQEFSAQAGIAEVPLPASAWLLLSALGGLGFFKRRAY